MSLEKCSQSIIRKFVSQIPVSDWLVESDTGWEEISYSNKTIEYEVFRITLSNGLQLKCADDHILMQPNGDEIFAKDSLHCDIATKDGVAIVTSIENLGYSESMYDLSVNSETNTYFTNNILSHNTQCSAAYILWYTIFQENKTVAILANKASAAREILSRYQDMFQSLPMWLQQGILDWNKGNVGLENGSKLFTAATSRDAIRGRSCVTGDSVVSLKNNITKEIILAKIEDTVEKYTSDKWKVLTPSGFSTFRGVSVIHNRNIVELTTNNTLLNCTPDHKLKMVDGSFKEVQNILPNEILYTGNIVKKIVKLCNKETVYDLLEVEFDHEYFTDGEISHNCNLIYCDEVAIIPNNIAEEFFTAVYPTISSGTTTKILLTSTPLGFNSFWKIFTEAEKGINDFIPISVHYSEIPGRDEAWAETQLKLLGELKFGQEVLCIAGETFVTVKHKITESTENIRIEDFYLRSSSKYQILTPSGWSDFDGIIESEKETIKITFVDQSHIICTHDHLIRIDKTNFVKASSLKPRQKFYDKVVLSVKENKKIFVYDPINVEKGNEYYSNGLISHNCHWLGSSLTLVRGDVIAKMTAHPYIYSRDNLDITEAPLPNHSYVLIADTSRGVGGDYSAFTVIDVTEIPYKMVAKFRDNKIAPLLYPTVIYRVATDYNTALVLVEINDIGGQVADILYQEMEYENMLFISKEKGGQKLSAGFSPNQQTGIRTDKLVKRIGCSTLKSLVEENKFIITDPTAVAEFSTFTENKIGFFAADSGYHDDIVITLVLFAWITTQPYFKDLTNGDLRRTMYESQINNIESNLTPFGFRSDGIEEVSYTENIHGQVWSVENAPERTFYETNPHGLNVWY